MSERWIPVVGWEGYYEVSDRGQVRSVDREIVRSDGQVRRFKGKLLSPGTNRHGYPVVVLSRPEKSKTMKVHRLVLHAFVGECPKGMEACHNNGVRADASLTNLRWDTPSSNQFDRRIHGTDHQVNKTHCPQGHAYTPENTKVIPSRPTARYCRQCHRERADNRWHTIHKPQPAVQKDAGLSIA